MDMKNGLYEAIFGGILRPVNGTVSSLPNILDGLDVYSGTEFFGSLNPDILGASILGSDHEVLGHVSENVMGGHTITLADGSEITGVPNLFGGEDFAGDLAAPISTSENVLDGFTVSSGAGEQLSASSQNIFDGFDAFTSPDTAFDSLDGLDTFAGMQDFGDINDIMDINSFAVDFMDASDGFGFLDSLVDLL